MMLSLLTISGAKFDLINEIVSISLPALAENTSIENAVVNKDLRQDGGKLPLQNGDKKEAYIICLNKEGNNKHIHQVGYKNNL